MSKAVFRLALAAALSVLMIAVMLTTYRPEAALSDATILQNAVQVVSNAESQSGPAIVPYAIAQTKDNYIVIKFLFGAGGGEGLVLFTPPTGPGKTGSYILLGKGGGDMTQSILTAFGVPTATASELVNLVASCPSGDLQPLLPGMPANGSICVVPPCPADSKGYCATISSQVDTGVCKSSEHSYVHSFTTNYIIWQGTSLVGQATGTQSLPQPPLPFVCEPVTTAWSPAEPRVTYNDPNLP
jgi:hypothetical protein